MEALVAKVSESGKTMLVGIKMNKFEVGYKFGWCANPDGNVKGDIIKDFPTPTGQIQAVDDKGNPVHHEDGTPVMRWVF